MASRVRAAQQGSKGQSAALAARAPLIPPPAAARRLAPPHQVAQDRKGQHGKAQDERRVERREEAPRDFAQHGRCQVAAIGPPRGRARRGRWATGGGAASWGVPSSQSVWPECWAIQNWEAAAVTKAAPARSPCNGQLAAPRTCARGSRGCGRRP
jgi:hypothetical protein